MKDEKQTWCGNVHPNGRSHCTLPAHGPEKAHEGTNAIWTDRMIRTYLEEHVAAAGGRIVWEKS